MHWLQIEGSAYWFVLAASFLGCAILESFRPKRRLSSRVERRWSRHGILAVFTSVALALGYRITPVMTAAAVADNRFGLLNRPWLPLTLRWLLAFLVVDLMRYAVHRGYHAVGFLWRIHQVHHSDTDIDVSTGFRIHPLEAMFTQGITLASIVILAPPVGAVLTFELAVCAQSFFGHANVSLPHWLDRRLRWVLITPDMHRVHHSVEIREQCCNLGDLFAWWDRLFHTYLADPAAGQEGMVVGLKECRSQRSLHVAFMLLQPFRPPPPAPRDPSY